MARNITAALPNCLILIWRPQARVASTMVWSCAEMPREPATSPIGFTPPPMRRTASGPGGKPVARNELGGMIDVLGKIVEHQLVRLTLAEAILVKELSRQAA
jgi:hypothetical protein